MPKAKRLKNVKDIAIIILLVLVGWQSCRKQRDTFTTSEHLISSDTIIKVGAPITNEHYYTRIVPERVVEHHYHAEPIDTNAVVQDYFRARYYRDSLVNDTVQFRWWAKVARNTLDSFHIQTRFQPHTRIITNKYEVNRPSVGLMAVYAAGTPYIGAIGTWQNRRFSISGGISPMNRGMALVGIGLKIGK